MAETYKAYFYEHGGARFVIVGEDGTEHLWADTYRFASSWRVAMMLHVSVPLWWLEVKRDDKDLAEAVIQLAHKKGEGGA